ncbi:MAG: DNA helicase RecQ [Eubacteriales bacterium]|nr:DNA helicase RecQ [Eubacteriales bacterium]
MTAAQDILEHYFGYDSFRPGQGELVEAILAGRDVLGIMPTGAGKSICYQVPALLRSGLTLVISPLIALMHDQVSALQQAGVPAFTLNSALSAQEVDETLYRVAHGGCKLLYVAPERLGTAALLELAQRVPIAMVTVDEAHCISQWGQDFRPSYLRIADFLAALPTRPVVSAFTATATAQVRTDIVQALGLRSPRIVTTSFDRPNLYFSVERPSSKPAALLRLLAARPGKSGIIYCATRKTVEDVCDMLLAKGVPATRYHAGLSAEERQRGQQDFLYDRRPVMVATNAFGMGIDKSNVSFVIHYNMPKDMESYYQEAGRAGRDGEAADCILLYSEQDVRTARFLIEHSRTAEDDALDPATRQTLLAREQARLRRMVGYATTADCLRQSILRYFGEDAPPTCGHCSNCDRTFDERDVTTEARKILSCVYRLDERGLHFGRTVVAGVLTGSKSEKIGRFGLETLSTYGIMADTTAKQVRLLIDALLERDYLRADPARYDALFLTPAGNALMRGRGTLVLRVARETAPRAAGRRTTALDDPAEDALFERLRALRATLAQQAHVPPYVIFSNATLADMAVRRPVDQAGLLAVRGVGEAKARRYGAAFLAAIRAAQDDAAAHPNDSIRRT